MDNTLDLVFTNGTGIFEARKRVPLLNSDHCIIRILTKVYGEQHKRVFSDLGKKTQHRCYSHDNNLRTMLKDTNWDLFTDQALDNIITNITHYLNFCLDVCCPKETIFLKFDRFFSSQLKKLRREKKGCSK
uniref:Uncharacterized protein n=1 Tax=Trichobilharzia regenti TaxID=157069 RepID=A0AA85KES4_TRIRE|nr:unnamed protein product [Trichobilharzia regenti]